MHEYASVLVLSFILFQLVNVSSFDYYYYFLEISSVILWSNKRSIFCTF